jgi:two-component system response regulator YesN
VTKLLIVDDDQFIREGLKRLIDWDELGIDIVGDAEGGNEAFRIVEERHPDIVLTDIRMPKGDGLEFIERIRQNDWDTQIVVLSGYNDYAYVRQAMKFQVEDYLLKPVDVHELTEIMKMCCQRIKDQWLNAQLKRETFQLLRNNVLVRWIENHIQGDQLREKLQFLKIDLKMNDLFQTAVITWRDIKERNIPLTEEQFRSFAILNSMEEALTEKGKGFAFINQNKHIICLFAGKSGTDLNAETFARENLKWMQDITLRYSTILKTPWFCTLGSVCTQVQAVHLSYQDAQRLQDYIDLTGGPQCVDGNSVVQQPDESAPGIVDREPIISALLAGSRAIWTEAASRDFQWAASQADPPSAAKYVATAWFVLVKLAFKRKRLNLYELLSAVSYTL